MNASPSATTNKVDTIVDTTNNIDGSSSSGEKHHTNQSISHSPPVIKNKPNRSEKQALYQSSANTLYARSNRNIGKEFKEKIDEAIQLNQTKAQWEKFFKNIDSNGILNLKNFSAEEIANVGEWLRLSPDIKLTGLTIDGSHIDESTVTALAKILKTNTSITTLTLFNNSLGTECIKDLADAITKSKITTLELARNDIRAGGTKVLASAIAKSQITSLVITEDQIGHEGAKALADAIPASKISKLKLAFCAIGNDGAIDLANSMPTSGITELFLNGNGIGIEGGEALAKAITQSKINTLSLRGEHIGDKGTKVLAEALHGSKVANLELVCASFSQEGIASLADLINSNKQLKNLNLTDNNIDDEGLKLLADSILNCEVNNLDISFNNITDKSLDALDQLKRNNSSIKTVNVLGTGIKKHKIHYENY